MTDIDRQFHITIVISVPGNRAEYLIMNNIAKNINLLDIEHDVVKTTDFYSFLKYIINVYHSDVVLLHSPLLLSSHHALVARILGKPIISLAWDSYPVTLGGFRYDRRLRRRIFDWIENVVLSTSKSVLVPSRDFLKERRLKHAHALGLWYPLQGPTQGAASNKLEEARYDDSPLQVLFAGQINATRGLPSAVDRLNAVTNGSFHLRIASPNPLPAALAGHPRIEHLGQLDRSALKRVAAECDCGLVSLAGNFDGPGLPSKTFEYLEAGIPCLYHGKRMEHYLDVLQRSGAGIDINVDACEALTREQVIALKGNITTSAADFMTAFELEPKALIRHLSAAVA